MTFSIPYDELSAFIRTYSNLVLDMKLSGEEVVSVIFRHPKASVLELKVNMKVLSVQGKILSVEYSTTGLVEELLRTSTSMFGSSFFDKALSFDTHLKKMCIYLDNISPLEHVLEHLVLERMSFDDKGANIHARLI